MYKFIRENGGCDYFEVVVLATKTYADKFEALREQRTHFEQANATLNGRVPSGSSSEYVQVNREHIIAQKKEYHVRNQTSISDQRKAYDLANRVAIAARTRPNYEAHRENTLAKKKAQYVAKKEARRG